jgi:hypothetical protein
MATYSGPLNAKKKGELQELALDLKLDTGGTKEELAERIRGHLTKHPLADDPRFAGLYGTRKVRPPTSKQ